MLQRYVQTSTDGINRFDYDGVSTADRQALNQYLAFLQQLDVDNLTRSEQKAFWINLYNAVTIQVVLDHYPVKSIRKIKLGGWFAGGPWDAELITIDGEQLTLNDIEHRILRPIWQDPLIHYGVNCASLGCPNLLTEAYAAERVNQQLASNARAFINSERGVSRSKRGLTLSSIYRWFSEDFGDDDQALLKHLEQYADSDLAQVLSTSPRIAGYDYDWALNQVN